MECLKRRAVSVRTVGVFTVLCLVLLFSGAAFAPSAFADIADDSSGITRDDVFQGPENSWRYEDGECVQDATEDFAETLDGASGRIVLTSNDAVGMGIDVSQFQGKINWDKVKAAGVSFAIIRCGYGSEFDTAGNLITSSSSKATRSEAQDDTYFEYNASECERLKIPYGVYLYSYAKNADMMKSEAVHAYRLVKGHHLSYPVYIDMEDGSTTGLGAARLSELAKVFCSAMNKTAYKPGIYANLNWWQTYLTDPALNSYEHWVAQWSNGCTYQGKYRLWQYSNVGRIAGISGNVDVNYQLYKTSIASCTATVDPVSFVYSGDANKPKVGVKLGSKTLWKSLDYTVSYAKNTNVGTATATIKGRGNYKGSVVVEFSVKPRPTAITELKAGSAKFRVTWKKRTKQSTGYQVRYSLNSNMSSAQKVTIKSDQTTSALIRGLKHKKTYYVQVRTYGKVGGKNYYSSWSGRKAIKTR